MSKEKENEGFIKVKMYAAQAEDYSVCFTVIDDSIENLVFANDDNVFEINGNEKILEFTDIMRKLAEKIKNGIEPSKETKDPNQLEIKFPEDEEEAFKDVKHTEESNTELPKDMMESNHMAALFELIFGTKMSLDTIEKECKKEKKIRKSDFEAAEKEKERVEKLLESYRDGEITLQEFIEKSYYYNERYKNNKEDKDETNSKGITG